MNRRAELQRKLASTPAPKPPADLAERIKKQIPENLRFDADQERERFGSAIGLNLGVAASILVLVATAFLALRILSRSGVQQAQPAAMKTAQPAVMQRSSSGGQPPAAVVETTTQTPPPVKHAARRTHASRAGQPTPTVLDSAGRSSTGTTVTNQVAELAPAPPPPPPAAAAAPAPVVQSIRVTASAPAVYDRTAKKIATNVPVDDALIQRSAAPPSLPDGITLDVEAAEQPLIPGDIVLRASFDCGAVVHDLRVDVLLGSDVTSSQRWLAMSWRWGTATFASSSRTTLVEFALPNTGEAPLATVRAHYRLDDDPAEQTLEKVVQRSDVASWSAASRRSKAATLAALWAHRSADRMTIANAAREAGLADLAAEIEQAP